jgi:Flp pilus assembly protein TadG
MKIRHSKIALMTPQEMGQAVVEMTLIIPFIAIFLFGVGSLGYLLYYQSEVGNAAHAGALYAMNNPASASLIATAAQNEASDLGSNLTVTSSTYYECMNTLNATPTLTLTQAESSCGSAGYEELVSVTTSAQITPPVTIPGTPSSYTLTGNSVMEVVQ